MFTNNKIRLSDLARAVPLDLVVARDAEISFVGKVPTLLPDRLVPLARPEHLAAAVAETGIAAVVVPPELAAEVPEGMGIVISDRPMFAALTIHEHLAALPNFLWQDFPSRIDPTATIMPGAQVAEKNVIIGPGCVIWHNAVVLERTIMGAHCSIGPSTAVATDAFEMFAGAKPRRILKQAGGVRMGDHVEIMANTTIIRATFGGFTWIDDETKIDTHIHLAHDVQLGKRVTIVACSEVSGRVEIGDDAYLGPNCTVSNGLKIGARATVSLGAVVTRDVPDDARVTGNFALPHDRWLGLMRQLR